MLNSVYIGEKTICVRNTETSHSARTEYYVHLVKDLANVPYQKNTQPVSEG